MHLLPTSIGLPRLVLGGILPPLCPLLVVFSCFGREETKEWNNCCLMTCFYYPALLYAAGPWGIDSLIHFALWAVGGWEEHPENSGDSIIPHLKFYSTNRLWSSSRAWAPHIFIVHVSSSLSTLSFHGPAGVHMLYSSRLVHSFHSSALLVVSLPDSVTRVLTDLHCPLPGCLFSHRHANASLSSHLWWLEPVWKLCFPSASGLQGWACGTAHTDPGRSSMTSSSQHLPSSSLLSVHFTF